MNLDRPDIRPLPPTVTGLLDDVARGVLPLEHLRTMRAAIETVPGPSSDWRSLLVTESLRSVQRTWHLKPTEGVVLVGSQPTGREQRRYSRNGWALLTQDNLLQEAIGAHRYRRCISLSTPKMRQAAMIEYLRNQKAPRTLLWPTLKALEKFYASAATTPNQDHLQGKSSRDRDALAIAQSFWDRQVRDPLGSRLGMPREAMAKLWQYEGGEWPSMAPNLRPKFIAVAESELLNESELDVLSAQPAAVVFYGDPAIGAGRPLIEELNKYPLGSGVLAKHNTSTLSLGEGLVRSIEHVQRNDQEIYDDWLQTVAALSGVTLGGHRQEFDAFRRVVGINQLASRQPLLTHERSRHVVSRYGVAGLRQQLNALRGVGEPCMIEGSAQWKSLLTQAIDVATVILLPQEEWPDKLKNRFKKGSDAALYAWSHSPDKKAIISLIHELRHPKLLKHLHDLNEVPYKSVRVVQASKLLEPTEEQHKKWPSIARGEFDAAKANLLPGAPVALYDDSLQGGSRADRGHYLYKQLSQQPISITAESQDTLAFLNQACSWLDQQHKMITNIQEAETQEGQSHLKSHRTPKEQDHELAADDTANDYDPLIEDYLDDHEEHTNVANHAEVFEEPESTYTVEPVSEANHYEPFGTSISNADLTPMKAYSDRMLEAEAAHEAALMSDNNDQLNNDAYSHWPDIESIEFGHQPEPMSAPTEQKVSDAKEWRDFLGDLRERQGKTSNSVHPLHRKPTNGPGF